MELLRTKLARKFRRTARARLRGGPDSAGMLSTRSESMTATARLALLRYLRRTAGTVVPAAAATDSRDIPA
jgi:hypothetical protein